MNHSKWDEKDSAMFPQQLSLCSGSESGRVICRKLCSWLQLSAANIIPIKVSLLKQCTRCIRFVLFSALEIFIKNHREMVSLHSFQLGLCFIFDMNWGDLRGEKGTSKKKCQTGFDHIAWRGFSLKLEWKKSRIDVDSLVKKCSKCLWNIHSQGKHALVK